MKREAAISLSIAVLSMTFLATNDAVAKSPKNPPATPSADIATVQSDAARMVTAQAGLVKPLDARKLQTGQPFQAVLTDKVQLKNGPELPRGTVLTGTASAGDAQAGGVTKLTLRFKEAQLKNGKVIPIKATIVGVFAANSHEREDERVWTPKMVQVYQTDVMSGVDLHSSVVDSDSGVFVSTKGDAVKLPVRNWIALAIEAQPDGQQETSGPNGGA